MARRKSRFIEKYGRRGIRTPGLRHGSDPRQGTVATKNSLGLKTRTQPKRSRGNVGALSPRSGESSESKAEVRLGEGEGQGKGKRVGREPVSQNNQERDMRRYKRKKEGGEEVNNKLQRVRNSFLPTKPLASRGRRRVHVQSSKRRSPGSYRFAAVHSPHHLLTRHL